jgi:hypothetical protein
MRADGGGALRLQRPMPLAMIGLSSASSPQLRPAPMLAGYPPNECGAEDKHRSRWYLPNRVAPTIQKARFRRCPRVRRSTVTPQSRRNLRAPLPSRGTQPLRQIDVVEAAFLGSVRSDLETHGWLRRLGRSALKPKNGRYQRSTRLGWACRVWTPPHQPVKTTDRSYPTARKGGLYLRKIASGYGATLLLQSPKRSS